MQSWGAVNLPDVNAESPRNTYMKPTKSAVIGFIRSALGETRDQEPQYDYNSLHMLTRTDRPGIIVKDYNVAQRTHHGFKAGATKVIPKYHLQDSTFCVLLGHENNEFINSIAKAIENPKWAPFIGRRAHILTLPPYLGIIETDSPREIIQTLPVIWDQKEHKQKTVLITDSMFNNQEKTNEMVDLAVNFNPKKRKYGLRSFAEYSIEIKRETETINLSTIDQYAILKESFK
jgi:CRISPR system Cascade subunit CasD